MTAGIIETRKNEKWSVTCSNLVKIMISQNQIFPQIHVQSNHLLMDRVYAFWRQRNEDLQVSHWNGRWDLVLCPKSPQYGPLTVHLLN